MTQYALNDRGTVEIITDDFYDAEILDVFKGKRLDLEQMLDVTAELVPEPDNPVNPGTVAVKVRGLKVGRMTHEDSDRYWNALSRVVASGYHPVVPLRLWAESRRMQGHTFLKTRGVLSVAQPDYLFPINATPTHAALLPQGPSVKVLGEQDHAEYLHQVLPESGDGRVILTLEADTAKGADGQLVEVVDVLHDRKVVGRLSTWMAEQLAPVVRYAFENNKLTAAWGTIRGNAFELSLTVQAVRAADIPREWFLDLPNDLPVLKEPTSDYALEPAYEPSSAEADSSLVRRVPAPRSGGGDTAEPVRATEAPQRQRAGSPNGSYVLGVVLLVLGVLVVIGGVALLMTQALLGLLGIVVGAALVAAGAVALRRQQGDGQPAAEGQASPGRRPAGEVSPGAPRGRTDAGSAPAGRNAVRGAQAPQRQDAVRTGAATGGTSTAAPVAQERPASGSAAAGSAPDQWQDQRVGSARGEERFDEASEADPTNDRTASEQGPSDQHLDEQTLDGDGSGVRVEDAYPVTEADATGAEDADDYDGASEEYGETEYVDPTFDDYASGSAYEEYSQSEDTVPSAAGTAPTISKKSRKRRKRGR